MHVVDSLGNGGLENGLVNLINGLEPGRFENVVYTIRHLGPNAERLPKDRTTVICQGKQDTDSAIQIGTLARAIRSIRPHIVHSRNWASIEAVIASRWVGNCAVVHSEHGLEAAASAKEPRRRIWFRRLAYEMADRVLSVSAHLRDLHTQRTGFRADRFTVVHNGVDSRRFSPNPGLRARMRKELGIPDDAFCIGCVGNLLPVKDHMTVLKAVEILAGKSAHWRLVIIGEGPERPKLEGYLDQYPEWKQQVSLPGTSHRVPEMLHSMDVYVLPSISEGISNSLLEAMSTGLAVIATKAGGNPEVVVNGESGLLFPVGDFPALAGQLDRLRTRLELRCDLAQQAAHRVRKEFSLDSMVQKYAGVYEGLSPVFRRRGTTNAARPPGGLPVQQDDDACRYTTRTSTCAGLTERH
jgi:sugar transferase (PEP-CTERM/EpsH1 system associated)